MNKFLLALPGIMLLGAATAFAQTLPLSTVFDIQNVPAVRLAACDDRPDIVGDTVRVRAIVITPGAARPSSSNPATRQVWIQDLDSRAGFHSITLFSTLPTSPDDILNLVPGDTIEVVGYILEFNGTGAGTTLDGETEIVPFADQVTIIGSNTGPAPASTLLDSVGVLNDRNRVNRLPSGEQWEGSFLELRNLTVTAVTPFSNNTRVSFTVADPLGNLIEISDRFTAGRLTNPAFVQPNVGDVFTSISGIIIHNKNGCPSTGANNRGYILNPFADAHYVRGAQAPTITAITRALVVPCSTDAVVINANIADDGTVASATLRYAIGAATTTYQALTMTNTGTAYTATIPAQPEGTFIKYYISATDNNNQTSNNPNVPNNSAALFYTVRCGALQVRDIQFTPFPNGVSGYVTRTVTNVEGIVTADATTDNLGQVYIQQPGVTAWGGIWLVGGPTVSGLRIGDKVQVSGTVEENFNVTRINVSASTVVNNSNAVVPVSVDPAVLTTYNVNTNEQYEGMLIKATNPTAGQNLFVVDDNIATDPSNFGEWRVGSDRFDPTQGLVVRTGSRNNTNYSSLSVSYINSLIRWRRALNDSNSAILIRVGDQFESVTGIVYFGFGVLKVLPRTNADLPGFISRVKGNVAASRFVAINPNPATGHATISISSSNLKKELNGARFQVTNSLGNSVNVAGKINGENTAIDISSLAPGLYNLIISGPSGIVTEKLVVE